jgi:hypothetical protein
MPNALQLFAVSALIGECQSLLASSALNPSQQAALRCLISHAQAAFSERKSEKESKS